MNITPIIEAIFGLCSLLITGFLIPYLKDHSDSKKLQKVMQYVDIFTAAADQIFTKEQFEDKKQYVIDRLAEKGYIIDAELDAKIEASVFKLHKEIKSIITEE